MSNIMDKLGNARRWAAQMSVNAAHTTMAENVLVDLIRAVEMLAMEREDKRANTPEGHGALPTAQEILDAWIDAHAATVLHRATVALDIVRDRVMPELAARDKRIAELEAKVFELEGQIPSRGPALEDDGARLRQIVAGGKRPIVDDSPTEAQLAERWEHRANAFSRPYRERIAELEQSWDMIKKSLDESSAQRSEGLVKIAELEKQIATLNDWAAICGGKAPTVDGKTPGQVFTSVYEALFFDALDAIMLKRRIDSDEILYEEREGARNSAMEAGIQAVLRVFGLAMVKQAAVGALRRTREQIEGMGANPAEQSYRDDVLAKFDDELASLEAPKPASDHAHELGSCPFCDKRPTGQEFVKAINARLPAVGININVESSVHWGMVDDVVGELFEQWRAESSPK